MADLKGPNFRRLIRAARLKAEGIDRATVNRLAADAGWQNASIRQEDLDRLERFAQLVLTHAYGVPVGRQDTFSDQPPMPKG